MGATAPTQAHTNTAKNTGESCLEPLRQMWDYRNRFEAIQGPILLPKLHLGSYSAASLEGFNHMRLSKEDKDREKKREAHMQDMRTLYELSRKLDDVRETVAWKLSAQREEDRRKAEKIVEEQIREFLQSVTQSSVSSIRIQSTALNAEPYYLAKGIYTLSNTDGEEVLVTHDFEADINIDTARITQVRVKP